MQVETVRTEVGTRKQENRKVGEEAARKGSAERGLQDAAGVNVRGETRGPAEHKDEKLGHESLPATPDKGGEVIDESGCVDAKAVRKKDD